LEKYRFRPMYAKANMGHPSREIAFVVFESYCYGYSVLVPIVEFRTRPDSVLWVGAFKIRMVRRSLVLRWFGAPESPNLRGGLTFSWLRAERALRNWPPPRRG
jgi:hypothetical protein